MPAEAMETKMSFTKRKSSSSDLSSHGECSSQTGPNIDGSAAQPHYDDVGSEIGTPPSNTVPNNSNEGEDEGFFRSLRHGIDSLYLSYKGKLKATVEDEITDRKKLAQSVEPLEVAQAQYKLGEHIFSVLDRGSKLAPFILEDNAYRIQCPKSNSSLPVAYVKVSSHALAHQKPKKIEEEVSRLVGEIGEEVGPPMVSRIDLFVDFISPVNMESWTREAWVSRAGSVNAYSICGKFSGWTVGAGGALSARLYNKSLEIAAKSKKTWLFPLWQQEDWNGEDEVWRLEFQFTRDILGQIGFREFDQVMRNLPGLWAYATTQWLKLTSPNPDDATRARWPIHPLWTALSSVRFDGSGGELSRTFRPARTPSHNWLMQNGLSTLTSHMAIKPCFDFDEGMTAFQDDLWSYHEARAYDLGLPAKNYLEEKIALKVRQFNTAMNGSTEDAEAREAQRIAVEAEAYRRQSKGG